MSGRKIQWQFFRCPGYSLVNVCDACRIQSPALGHAEHGESCRLKRHELPTAASITDSAVITAASLSDEVCDLRKDFA